MVRVEANKASHHHEDLSIPIGVALVATQDRLDAWIDESKAVSPPKRHLRVVRRRDVAALPGA